jgi:hypothetical protein
MPSQDPPAHVYPDPDGATNNSTYVPSNTAIDGAGIAAGLISAGAAAAGTGAAVEASTAFLQSAAQAGGAYGAAANIISAVPIQYVAVSILFGLLSVGLNVWNLVQGYRMKVRLLKLSRDICKNAAPVIDAYEKAAIAARKAA